jgi:hypothetical protein
MVPDAVYTDILIDDINTVAGRDGGDRAFRFTGTAIGAFVGNTVWHLFPRLGVLKVFDK